MNPHLSTTLRNFWWRRFHPLVRLGWYTATVGDTRPRSQTALGFAVMGLGFTLRRMKKARTEPVYVHMAKPGDTTRIRVAVGDSVPTETIVRT